MDNYDKLFNQIKDVSRQQETKDFPAMDKVWSRVEEKLDHKVLKKENRLWKKIAVAASFLLLTTIGYQIFKPDNRLHVPKYTVPEEKDFHNQREVLRPEAKEITVTPEVKTSPSIQNPVIKKEAARVLENQISSKTEIAVQSTNPVPAPIIMHEKIAAATPENHKSLGYANSLPADLVKNKKSAVANVNKLKETNFHTEAETVVQPAGKLDPLIVVDGIPAYDNKTLKEQLLDINPADVDSFVVLKEPLYIINGQYYSEQELFGPNPTSPYAPLNKQEIESISILQGEKAIQNYGTRGSKGVVIISTKNLKPLKAADSGK